MFIYNFKINGTKIFKIFFSCLVLLMIVILSICVFRIFKGAGENFVVADNINEDSIFEIESKNYANILKSVHDDIDTYVGKKIKFTGYVYRVNDISKNQFILARNMLSPSKQEYVVVGFLCEYNNSEDFANDAWVEITGEIKKGTYHGSDMPYIQITNMHTVQKPSDEFVNPPDDMYIPTSSII